MRITPNSGKIALRFKKELIVQFERDRPLDLSWGRIIIKEQKAFDYTVKASVEIAEVIGVNAKQTFYRVGDTVLVSYLVFYDGRGKNARGNPIRFLHKYENGDELFFAYDGTDEWDNNTEIYAKLNADGLLVPPSLIMINEPRKNKKIGNFYLPPEYQKENREVAFYATVENINPADSEKMKISVGQEIICAGGLTYEVVVGGAEKKSFYFINNKYVLASIPQKIAIVN